VNAGSADVAEAILGLTDGRGADGVVETTGSVAVLRKGADALAARGTLVAVGAPPFGTEVALDVNALLPGKRVVGLTLGDSETQTSIPALVRLVRDGRLPLHRLISHYPFADIERAARDMSAGRTIKPVLTFGQRVSDGSPWESERRSARAPGVPGADPRTGCPRVCARCGEEGPPPGPCEAG
jgi:aryl-alcohol dehydrogenase